MSFKLVENVKEAKRPFVVAGPCSVESQEQMLDIAQSIAKNSNVKLLRGGIWKPRTRPNSFEGVGGIGLPWLVEAGKTAGLPVATEIANAQHVELALKAGVDVLWIGARTTVNPFAVQEIADAIRGTDIPVMIKNPINPDLNLWIGAFERLAKANVKDLVGIHRGFSVYNHPKYRNAPNWEIPIGLMEKMSEIPIINDPSHICGNRTDLLSIAQKAMDLNFAGLMIETHPNPDKAWSDAEQQITPDNLQELLNQLILRDEVLEEGEVGFLELQRRKISELDDELFQLLQLRMQIAEDIGKYKRENGIVILQSKHWHTIVHKQLAKSNELGLSEEFLRIILDAIHQESINKQNSVMNF